MTLCEYVTCQMKSKFQRVNSKDPEQQEMDVIDGGKPEVGASGDLRTSPLDLAEKIEKEVCTLNQLLKGQTHDKL